MNNAFTKSEQLDSSGDFYKWTAGEDLRELQKVLHLIAEMEGKTISADRSFWSEARGLAWTTKLVEIEEDSEFTVETGDDGKPYHEGGSFPVGVKILESEKLTQFVQYVDSEIERLDSAIRLTFGTKKKFKWRCPKCGHFMDAFEKKKLKKLDKVLRDPTPRICKKCRERSILMIWARKGLFRVFKVVTEEKLQKDKKQDTIDPGF